MHLPQLFPVSESRHNARACSLLHVRDTQRWPSLKLPILPHLQGSIQTEPAAIPVILTWTLNREQHNFTNLYGGFLRMGPAQYPKLRAPNHKNKYCVDLLTLRSRHMVWPSWTAVTAIPSSLPSQIQYLGYYPSVRRLVMRYGIR